MKKALWALFMLSMLGINARAGIWEDLVYQTIDQTEVTIHKSGGPAGFWDLSVGNDYSLKQGVLSHVLTNRFISGSLGWYTANDKEGVIVGGPSLRLKELALVFIPGFEGLSGIPVFKSLDTGFNFGWGTDRGSQHYGFHIFYDFGK